MFFNAVLCPRQGHLHPTTEPWTHLLSLRGLLADGGHLWRRCPLAGASFQQVNARGSAALLVLKVEENVLVESKVLLRPAAVLRGFLTQEAAFGAFFTRNHRQMQSMALVVAHALLHRRTSRTSNGQMSRSILSPG